MPNTPQDQNRIFAIIPARGGSKRLAGKNIFPINGKPMVLYTVEAGLKSMYLSAENLFLSTEDSKIKETVKPFVKVIDRPQELSGDKVWTQDVVNHFSEQLKLKDEDIIVILQANSPQITAKIIDNCIDMLLKNDLWQVHTVDTGMINNGAVQVMRAKVSHHKGKANYNGVVVTNLVDVHTIEDVELVKQIMSN